MRQVLLPIGLASAVGSLPHADAAEAVIQLLRPLQQRYAELTADPGETARILALGAEKARKTASATMIRVRDRLGLPAL